MPTTTNYGWTTPADTDLVKDGASAIRTLGTAIDTTTKNLNPETTLGDISYRSSTANTNTRLALGTAGQVLTVNSGATAPEWSTPIVGGMTLISTTTLTGASVTLSAIPQTHKNLQLVIRDYLPATDNTSLIMRPNNDTGTNYVYGLTGDLSNQTFTDTFFSVNKSADNTVTQNLSIVNLFDYTNTITFKIVEIITVSINATTNTNVNVQNFIGISNQTAAISSIVLAPNNGNFTSGTAYLYGVS